MFKAFLHPGACFKGLTRITLKGIALAREYLIYEWFSGFPIRYPIRYPISFQLVSNYDPNQKPLQESARTPCRRDRRRKLRLRNGRARRNVAAEALRESEGALGLSGVGLALDGFSELSSKLTR